MGSFFLLSLVNDIFKHFEALKKFLDKLYFGLLFPSTFATVVVFWPAFTFHPLMIMNKKLEVLSNAIINNLLHTIILIPVVIDMILIPKEILNRKIYFNLLGFMWLLYVVVFLLHQHIMGYYFYPLYDQLSFLQIIFLKIFIFLILYIMQDLGFFIHKKIWKH